VAWTEDRVEILTKLWAEGLSASQIAKQLGGVTRNAVIGKVHRLGLSGRAKPSNPAKKKARKTVARTRQTRARSAPRAPRPVVQPRPAPPPIEALPMADGRFATILTITDHMCKWPIGDPSTSEFRFCGRKTDDKDEPYCKAHSSVAYQASRRRGSKPRALGPSQTSRKRIR